MVCGKQSIKNTPSAKADGVEHIISGQMGERCLLFCLHFSLNSAMVISFANWSLLITSVFLLRLSCRPNRKIELLVAPNYVS